MTDALDSSASDALSAALAWLQGTLLGPVATTVAIIAVASVGFLMLAGRIDVRRAAQVIFGCFILFGASTIASGIMTAVNGTGGAPETAAAETPRPYYPPAQAQTGPGAYDPYAGAAMPTRN